MTRKRGTTLVEVLVALVLVFLVLAAARRVVEAGRRSAARILEAAEALETERILRWVVREEVRAARPGVDWSVDGDSLPLRAFRGVARVCAHPGNGRLLVHWRGMRAPDPRKDSVLLLARSGAWTGHRLTGRDASARGCGETGGTPGGRVEEWRVDPAPPGTVAPTLARFFERGVYFVADSALRYRRGGGGRQPLTAARLDPSGSGMSAGPGGSLVLRALPFSGAGPARPVRWRLHPLEDGG